ncbi:MULTISPECIES: hypothetical protein [Halostella]|nr:MULTISPECIES: hypothetical protein [Halostella]
MSERTEDPRAALMRPRPSVDTDGSGESRAVPFVHWPTRSE